jgi:hypothetical protein
MKWLKKLLGMEPVATPSAPAEAGAKAFDNMARTLAPEVKVTTVTVAPAPEPKVDTVTVVAEPAPEVQAVAVKVAEAVVEAKPKAPRKPRAKKAPAASLPQTVVQNVEQWPFPGNRPAEGEKRAKPAARTVKAK